MTEKQKFTVDTILFTIGEYLGSEVNKNSYEITELARGGIYLKIRAGLNKDLSYKIMADGFITEKHTTENDGQDKIL